MITRIYLREQWAEVNKIPVYKREILDKDLKYKYEISNHGRVKRDGKIIIDYNHKKYKWTYIKFSDGNKIIVPTHRLVAFYFVKGFDIKLVANHIDGDTSNNFYYNLEWVTQNRNAEHAHETGLIDYNKNKGENTTSSKITNDDAEYICLLLSKRVSIKDILHEVYGSTYDIIYDIYRRKTWTFISDKYIFPKISNHTTNKFSEQLKHDICKYMSNHTNAETVWEFKNDIKQITSSCPYVVISDIRRRKRFKKISILYF